MKKIFGIIRRLGVTSNYKGYFFVADAIQLAMQNQGRPLQITKDIYPVLAKKHNILYFLFFHSTILRIYRIIDLCLFHRIFTEFRHAKRKQKVTICRETLLLKKFIKYVKSKNAVNKAIVCWRKWFYEL